MSYVPPAREVNGPMRTLLFVADEHDCTATRALEPRLKSGYPYSHLCPSVTFAPNAVETQESHVRGGSVESAFAAGDISCVDAESEVAECMSRSTSGGMFIMVWTGLDPRAVGKADTRWEAGTKPGHTHTKKN